MRSLAPVCRKKHLSRRFSDIECSIGFQEAYIAGAIHIGTSGWHYNHWRGPFYPADMKSGEFLPFYRETFDTAEINTTFYSLPDVSTLESWRDTTPEPFLFAVKASRYITHMKKLKHPADAVERFMDRTAVLGAKRGPVLFQLPPHWRKNTERLRSFLKLLPPGVRYVFEFRDSSWFAADIFEALAAHNAALCIYDFDGRESPREITADFVYIRLHGPGGPYRGSYDSRALSGWAGALTSWARSGRDVYCYFDNDQDGYAPQNARSLLEMTGGN